MFRRMWSPRVDSRAYRRRQGQEADQPPPGAERRRVQRRVHPNRVRLRSSHGDHLLPSGKCLHLDSVRVPIRPRKSQVSCSQRQRSWLRTRKRRASLIIDSRRLASTYPVAGLCRLALGEATAFRVCDIDLARCRIDLRCAFSDVGGRVTLGTRVASCRTVPIPRFSFPAAPGR